MQCFCAGKVLLCLVVSFMRGPLDFYSPVSRAMIYHHKLDVHAARICALPLQPSYISSLKCSASEHGGSRALHMPAAVQPGAIQASRAHADTQHDPAACAVSEHRDL